MADKRPVECEFCGKIVEYVKACIGFGIEKPVSESHFFCSEEHRSEFIISETAKERGVEYTIRKYENNGRKVEFGKDLTEDEMKAFENGEIVSCVDDGNEVMKLYLDPFGDLKEY